MSTAPALILTPAELAAVVRQLGRGRSLADCLRRLELERGVFTITEARADARRLTTHTQTEGQNR